jgi:superfamily II DNA or RNA helicase
MKPLKHQEKFIKGYSGKRLLVHEAGTGKTICACLWLKDGRDTQALVICPKQIVEKWEKTLALWGTKAKVLSKENFKKEPLTRYSAVIVDEMDQFASPLYVKGRSQLTERLYNLIKLHNERGVSLPILGLTATPIRSNPWNLHTLLCFIGVYIDWKVWQKEFFVLEKRPYLPRMAWFPKKDWRQRIRPVLEKYADIVLLKDCVDYLPPVTEETIKVKSEKYVPTEWEPTKAFFDEHRHEQKNKVEEIKKLSTGYRKIVIVVYYVEQVERLAEELGQMRETFMIHGGVKGHEEVIKKANDSDECFMVIQASIGAGFDLSSFGCVIFASMSYSVRDKVQMMARVRRINDLHPVHYVFLIGGRCDKSIKRNVDLGKDFVPSLWVAKDSDEC